MSITGMEAAIWGWQHECQRQAASAQDKITRILLSNVSASAHISREGEKAGIFHEQPEGLGDPPAAPRGIASMGVSKSVKSGPSIDSRRERVEQGLGLPQVERTFCQEAGHQRHLICSYFHHTGEELFYRGFQNRRLSSRNNAASGPFNRQVEGSVMSPTMASDRDQAGPSTSERPSWPTTPYRDIQVQIGQALRLQYESPSGVTRPTTYIVDASDGTGRERLTRPPQLA